MYLVDDNGKVWCDEEQVDERLVASMQSPKYTYATLAKHPTSDVLYRFDKDGNLSVYLVGDKPFLKFTVPLIGQKTYQEQREYISEEVRIIRIEEDKAQVYINGQARVMPEELLLRW